MITDVIEVQTSIVISLTLCPPSVSVAYWDISVMFGVLLSVHIYCIYRTMISMHWKTPVTMMEASRKLLQL